MQVRVLSPPLFKRKGPGNNEIPRPFVPVPGVNPERARATRQVASFVSFTVASLLPLVEGHDRSPWGERSCLLTKSDSDTESLSISRQHLCAVETNPCSPFRVRYGSKGLFLLIFSAPYEGDAVHTNQRNHNCTTKDAHCVSPFVFQRQEYAWQKDYTLIKGLRQSCVREFAR